MRLKLLIITFFILSNSIKTYAFVRPRVFGSTFISIEESILKNTINGQFKNATSALSDQTIKTILNDKKNLVFEDFVITPYFKPNVYFWFSIYTQYTSQQVVIHDKNSLDIVYNIIDYSELHKSKINRYAKAKLQAQLSLEYTRRLKKILYKFAKSIKKLNSEELGILKSIKKSPLKIPKSWKAKKRFFRKLAAGVRTQTGQRNMIYQGVLRSMPYLSFLKRQLKSFRLPKELLAISFLESSFNPNAESRVGAAGAWQFMPYIGGLFMPKRTKHVDYRLNPVISSLSAFHLLRQNKMILKRWDLAIPAYNSGTKHYVKARRKYKKAKNFNLEYVLRKNKTAHIGFASKNFYAEFLALVHVLAYKDVIYPLEGFEKRTKKFRNDDVHVYLSKCSVVPANFISLLKKSSPNIKDINNHFHHTKRKFPRGTLLVSDIKLTSRKYLKLTQKQIKAKFPKNWIKYLKKSKCRK